MYGILSTFDVLCGNATYSNFLALSLEQRGHRVRKISLLTELQKNDSKVVQKSVLEEVGRCKIINIQLELGLYGSSPHRSAKFIKKILKACPEKTTITVHRVEKRPDSILRKIKKNFLSGTSFAKTVQLAIKDVYLFKVYKGIYSEIRRQASKKNIVIIAHTYMDQKKLLRNFNVESTVHPIMWPQHLVGQQNKINQNLDSFTVGVFGFISAHKNFEIVIEAFKNLVEKEIIPDNSTILICGGHHPEAPTYGLTYTSARKIKPYPFQLSQYLESMKYSMHKIRVKWIVGSTDEEMAVLMSKVDVTCIPYAETGQSGSGITSQALQYSRGIAMSDTIMASQHQKLCDGKIILFDTASVQSCETAILSAKEQSLRPKFKNNFAYKNIIDLIEFKKKEN